MSDNAAAWSGVVDFFDAERSTADQIYPSEWFFLRDRLKPGLRVLDIGCAQGGFAAALGEHVPGLDYTGIDINADMIARARARHPGHAFHVVGEDEWGAIAGRTWDLVLCLGILHLHEGWRRTMAMAWRHTAGCLILDLREHQGPTIEDKTVSNFRMDFGGAGDSGVTLPYVIVNSADALGVVRGTCADARRIAHYGYLHPVSGSARTPVDKVMANVWCVER